MAITLNWLDFRYTTNPTNPNINNRSFTSKPVISFNFNYESVIPENDDLNIEISNTLNTITDRNDFRLEMSSNNTLAEFLSEEPCTETETLAVPSAYIKYSESYESTLNINQIVRIHADDYAPEAPTYKYVGEIVNIDNVNRFAYLSTQIPTEAGTIASGTTVFTTKYRKQVTGKIYFRNDIASSGEYAIEVKFTINPKYAMEMTPDSFYNGTIEFAYIGQDDSSNTSEMQSSAYYKHQFGYSNKNLDFMDTGKIIVTHDDLTPYTEIDAQFKYKITLRGFKNKSGSQTIDSTETITKAVKTDLNVNGILNLVKVPETK